MCCKLSEFIYYPLNLIVLMPQPRHLHSDDAKPFLIKIVQEIEGIMYFRYCFSVLKYYYRKVTFSSFSD